MGDMPGIPSPARPLMAGLKNCPTPCSAPPITGILVARPPKPPSTPPKAVPTPGTKAAIGATFLMTLPTLPKTFFNFLKKPNSSKPVIGLRLATPAPTIASSGLIPSSLNFVSNNDSTSSSSNISGGRTISPARKCANSVSSPCPAMASSCPKEPNGASLFIWPLCARMSNKFLSSSLISTRPSGITLCA